MANPLNTTENNSRENQPQSDSQKAVRRHLEDENHVISEDDIRNVRVGVTPEKVDTGEELVKQVEEENAEKKDDEQPNDKPITPWDVVNE